MGKNVDVIGKLFPGVNKHIEQIDKNRYSVRIESFPVTIDGEITINGSEMRYDIKRIKTPDGNYIVTKQFYKRPSTDSITRIGNYVIVTNLSVETPNRTTRHSTNYRVNIEYLFSVPVRSLVTTNRSIYSDISLFRIKKYPAYMTLETKTEKYKNKIIEDVEKAILIYSFTQTKTQLEYYDILKPLEIETNTKRTGNVDGMLSKIKNLIFSASNFHR